MSTYEFLFSFVQKNLPSLLFSSLSSALYKLLREIFIEMTASTVY